MSKQFYRFVKNEAGESELYLEGVIAAESWWDDEITPKAFREQLDNHPGDITVRINSPGGDAFAGVQIYNMLKDRKDNVKIIVDGLAASAASVVAMAGDQIVMNTGSTMMIHKASTFAWGNEEDMMDIVEMLQTVDSNLVSIYTARTGKTEEEIKELLAGDGTWFTADEAVEKGFADEATPGKSSVSEAIQNVLGFAKLVDNAAMQPVMNLQTKLKNEAEEEKVEETDDGSDAPEATDEAPAESDKEDAPAPTEPEEPKSTEESEEVEEEINTDIDKEEEMSEIDETAAETVVTKAAPKQEVKDTTISKTEARKLIVTGLAAKFSKDDKAFEEVNAKLSTTQVSNVIDGTTGAPLFAEEVLANDIRDQYTVVGRVGALVNRIDIEGAETFRQLVETAGNGFTPVALGEVKDQDQPVWTSVVFEPFEWALIVAWLDGVQKRSPIAVYNQVVRYIAREYAKLEDKIILTYAGGTYDGEVRPATGLVPILTTANRDETVASYDSEDVIPALGLAYGEVESDLPITLVANRRTWAQLATSLDGMGRPLFTVVGEQVAAGALGTFNVVQSQVLDDGEVVVGAFGDYNLVTRGGLGTLFSQEATVGSLNLFTQDASALRADVDITGKPVFNTSFFLLNFPASS